MVVTFLSPVNLPSSEKTYGIQLENCFTDELTLTPGSKL